MTGSQKRALQGGLHQLEEFLMDFLQEIRGERPLRTGYLLRETDPLPQDPWLLQGAGDLLIRVRELAKLLGLEAIERSRRRMRLAQMAVLWAHLEDLRPEGLRRYGPLEGQEARWLGGEMEGLLQSLLRLVERVEKAG